MRGGKCDTCLDMIGESCGTSLSQTRFLVVGPEFRTSLVGWLVRLGASSIKRTSSKDLMTMAFDGDLSRLRTS
jgi:hypothetical protein